MNTATNCKALLSKLEKQDEHLIHDRCETFNSRTQRSKDLFNFIDLLAVHPRFTLGIQTFTEGTLKAHLDKLETPSIYHKMRVWLHTNQLELWVWSDRKYTQKNGKKVTKRLPHFLQCSLSSESILVTPNHTVLQLLGYELPSHRKTDCVRIKPTIPRIHRRSR